MGKGGMVPPFRIGPLSVYTLSQIAVARAALTSAEDHPQVDVAAVE